MARRARKSRAGIQRWNQLVSALRLMNFAFNNVRLYPPTHTEVMGVVAKLQETLTPIIEEQEDVGFGFMDALLYIEGAMSLEETASNQMLVDRFSKCRVKYLTLMKGLSVQDLLVFFQVLNAESIKPTTEHPAELIDKQGVKTIHIVEAEVDDTASKSKLARKKTLLDWYEKAIATLQTAQVSLRDDAQADLKPLYRMIDDMMATIRNKGYDPFLLLPALGAGLDPHLAHNVNVGILCCALGDLYGLNSGQINTLCVMAYLHDLGRIIIPPEWASEHIPLAEDEKAVVRQHADWGFLLLARNEEVPPQVAVLAAQHHGDATGRGEGPAYHPDVYHRILAVADAYDLALAGDSYYWKQRRKDQILKVLLNERGRRFDPAVVKLLVDCVGYFPVGTVVQLEDGQRGIVVRPNPANAGRPRVFLHEAEPPAPQPGAPAAPEDVPPMICDLSELDACGLRFKNSIATVLAPPPSLELRAVLDGKKEFLLSYTL